MTEYPLETEDLYGLIIQQSGKPQRVLTGYLRMILNFRYGLGVKLAHSIVEGCFILRRYPGSIACAFVVQNEEIESKTVVNTLCQQGRIPLILLLPRDLAEMHRSLCESIPNVAIGLWENAFNGSSTSIRETIEGTFRTAGIDLLLGGEEKLSHSDLQKRIGRRIKNLPTLPTLPQVVLKIMRLIEDAGSTVEEMETVISSDPSMVWKLLEVIKAPVFAGTRRSEWTLREIIVRLGRRKVGAIAQQIRLMNGFIKPEESRFDLVRFWEHSLGCAVIADKLYTCGQLDLENRVEFDQYWIGALLHDIGKLVLGVFFPAHFDKIIGHMDSGQRIKRDFRQAEEQIHYPGLHEQIARLLLLKADAGPDLTQAVGAHHTGGEKPDDLACLLHIADNLSKDLGFGYLEKEQGRYDRTVLRKLNLRREDLRDIEESLRDSVADEIRDLVRRSTIQEEKRPRSSVSTRPESREESAAAPSVPEAPPLPTPRERAARLADLLNQLRKRLRRAPELTAARREDLLVDIELIAAQLRKNEPNPAVLATLLDEFSRFAFSADLLPLIKVVLAEDYGVKEV